MVVITEMNKPTLTVSVSDSEASSVESESEAEASADEAEGSAEEVEADAESDASNEESGPSNEESSDEANTLMTNEGWADSVKKILGSSKPKNKKTLVLSRAKKFSEIVKTEKEEKPAFEIIGDGEVKEEKPLVKKEDSSSAEPPVKKKKIEKASIKVKPNILEKDRERLLSKVATKGVVQLFNAVRNQQKSLEKQVDRSDLSEGKKEKILKKFDKRAFLDTLMGQTKSVVVDEAAAAKSLKNEVKDEEKPRWSALRDDFMTGAKMKDWDKESVSSSDDE